jgi:hypothetical protein
MSADNDTRFSYAPDTIAFGMRYAEAVFWDETGKTLADISRVSLLEPDPPASRSANPVNQEPPV